MFSLDVSIWNATDIVVATEGPVVNGVLTVLQTWKGPLSPGDTLNIEELREFADEDSRTVKHPFGLGSTKDPGPLVVLSGQRMVLFLKRDAWKVAARLPSASLQWESTASWGGIKVSVAWIEDDVAYYFSQGPVTIGPAVLYRSSSTEEVMRKRVRELAPIRKSLDNIAALPRAQDRAEQVVPYIKSNNRLASREAFDILSDAKKPALPYLRRMLVDNTYERYREKILKAMVVAGGASVAPDFVTLIEQELAYWQMVAPTLPVGWWNDNGVGRAELRYRYGQVLHVLHALRELKYEPSREAVTALRDYWRSVPQLVEIEQILESSDAVLRSLDRPAKK